MKFKNVFLIILGFAIVATSCKKDDNEVTPSKITLNKETLSVEVGKTETLEATLEPSGVTGTVVWASLNSSVATVSEGVVTGVKEGTTTISASVGNVVAICVVTVTKEGSGGGTTTSTSLKGSNYYVLFLDDTSLASISSKVITDLRPDESTAVVDIWPSGDSYTGVESVGPNFYGEVAGWISLKSNATPWGGTGAGGIRQIRGFDLSGVDGTYTFHCGYKGKDGGKNELCFFSQDGSETWITLPAATDGEWKEFEIPMSQIISAGWNFSIPYVLAGDGRYSLGFRSSPANTTLNLDAAFFYKK